MINTYLIVGTGETRGTWPEEVFEGTLKEVRAYVEMKNENARLYEYSYRTIRKVEGIPEKPMRKETPRGYCEFPGDGEHFWDEDGWKGKCEHVGISHCQLHKVEHEMDAEGWRRCCGSCETPYYEKKEN